MARIDLLQNRDDVAPEHHALFDELAALRGRISGPSSIVLHSPGLARPWNQISEFLHGKSIVEAKDAELAVCATARHFDCAYVWAAHLPQARAAGVSEATLVAVATGMELEGLPASEAAVVRYVRQLLSARRVDQPVFDALLQAHDARWLLELTAWVGRYASLTILLNCFEVAPAPDAAVLPPSTAQADVPARPVRAPLAAPRVTPLTSRDQVAEAHQRVFDAVAEGRGNVRGPFSMLMYSPVLCDHILVLSNYLREDNFIAAATRELAVIATARERDCPYVWSAHAPAARREGVAEPVVVAVRDRGELAEASAEQRDVVELARQALRTHRVEQALFDRLLAEHSLPGLVELTAVIGQYVFVTAILNAFEVAPAAGAEVLP